MKLRALITVLVSVSAVLFVIAFYRLLISTQEVARQEQDAEIVHQLVSNITDLRFILTESVLYKEDRSRQQWVKKLGSLRALLLTHQYVLPIENTHAKKIISAQDSIDIAYSRLAKIIYPLSATAPVERQDELIARTTSSLYALTQDMLDQAAQISRINREATVKNSERRKIVSFITISLFGAIIGFFIFVIL